jgi:GNAT superfamily N-acetyltransferase
MAKKPILDCHPLTPDRWADFEQLFGPNGACAGCWCTTWRRTRSEFNRDKGEGNRRFFLKVVESGEPTGILGYIDGEPVAWCAVAPREAYSYFERSRILQPVDDTPVWSVTCFFIHKDHRRKGLTVQLLREAVQFVKDRGGKVVEGYPVEPMSDNMPVVFAWTGMASAFLAAGFKEVARRSDSRPIMRFDLMSSSRRRTRR